MKQVTILHTPIRFFPYIGGVENHVLYLTKELKRNSNHVEVLCANEPYSNISEVNGVHITRLPFQFKITNTNISLAFPFKLFKSKFDIIHTHMPTPWTADLSVLLAKILKRKSIITIHNDMDKSSFLSKLVTKFYLNTVFQFTLMLVDKIIIVNPEWQKSFIETKQLLLRYENKITVIPNGIDLEIFTDNVGHDKREENTILFVSILDKHHKFKGLDYLLKSLVEIKKVIPNIKLIIVGEGELKEFYKQKAKTLGLSKQITFVGALKQHQLSAYYKKASVFVLPSTEIEGFGIVLLEAMACSLPIVSTDIVGVAKDIKTYKTGLIVKPKDANALTAAITKLLKDNKLSRQMGKNGRKLVEKNYDWRLIAKQVEKVYQEILV